MKINEIMSQNSDIFLDCLIDGMHELQSNSWESIITSFLCSEDPNQRRLALQISTLFSRVDDEYLRYNAERNFFLKKKMLDEQKCRACKTKKRNSLLHLNASKEIFEFNPSSILNL